MLRFLQDPITLLRRAAAKYGDVVTLRGGSEPLILVNRPDLIHEIFVTNNAQYKKGRGLEHARRFLGDGLLTSEGDLHKRQRRMIQPAFHRRQIERYADIVTSEARVTAASWRNGQTFDLMSEMMRITMPIVAKALFGSSVRGEIDRISEALGLWMSMFRLTMLPFAELLEKLPLPVMHRLHEAEQSIDNTIAQMITERRELGNSADNSDLLGMMLAAQDTGEDGPLVENKHAMSDQQIHDEVLTLFIAGHETTSVWLTWTWYLLSQHPEIEKQLFEEANSVLGKREARFEDMDDLTLTRRVLSESLRLYPPAWAIGRRALVDVKLDDFDVPAGSIVLIAPIVTHVDGRFWRDPRDFNPDRWLDPEPDRPKFAFIPFGGGPRTCIGDQFAWMEATLLLATLIKEWRVEIDPNFEPIPRPMVTLRPRDKMMVTVRPSGAAEQIGVG